jgi:hypothetical protein
VGGEVTHPEYGPDVVNGPGLPAQQLRHRNSTIVDLGVVAVRSSPGSVDASHVHRPGGCERAPHGKRWEMTSHSLRSRVQRSSVAKLEVGAGSIA